MIVAAFGGFDDWRAWAEANDALRKAHHLADLGLPAACGPDGWPGHCRLCARDVAFRIAAPAGGTPDLRESLDCPGCGLNARVRAALWLLDEALAAEGVGRAARVCLTEQASPAFVWAQRRYERVHGSEFVRSRVRRARLALRLWRLGGRGGVRFGDVEALAHADASLDAVASFEVLEHLPDPHRALLEFARVLRPGGCLVLTLPFLQDARASLQRARIGPDGAIEHLAPPEYHDDPVSGGVLCFRHFGWDLLDAIRDAGFAHAEMVLPWDLPGGWPTRLWTLRARR